MTQFVFISVVLIQVTISAVINAEIPEKVEYGKEEQFRCDEKNAVKSDCATYCDVDKCPDTEHYSRECAKDTCKPGCKCRFNEKFSKNGTCISAHQCPPFNCDNPNEEFVACPSYCSESCSQGGCPNFGFILMVVECFPSCRCKQGFCRKDGICVSK